MAYLIIGDKDFSAYVNELTINKSANYNAQTNAAGDTVIDYINSKRTITVGFIPMNDANMIKVLNAIDKFNVSLSFRNPRTNLMEENINCIVPQDEIKYYTIQQGKVLYNAFSIDFIEL